MALNSFAGMFQPLAIEGLNYLQKIIFWPELCKKFGKIIWCSWSADWGIFLCQNMIYCSVVILYKLYKKQGCHFFHRSTWSLLRVPLWNRIFQKLRSIPFGLNKNRRRFLTYTYPICRHKLGIIRSVGSAHERRHYIGSVVYHLLGPYPEGFMII